jgi:hypothetical protein
MADQAPPFPQPQLMLSQPGVQRDGTRLASKQYLDARWCRFHAGLPRKMLGFCEQVRDVDGLVRQFGLESYDGFSYVHAGTQNVLQRYTINLSSGAVSGLTDRTPVGFAASEFNNWQFSVVYNTANDSNLLLAHAAPNINDITDTAERPVYYGEVRDTAALLEITGSEVSGGVCAMWPYFLRFGNDGEVAWPVPGNLTDLTGTGSGSARPCGNKIVRGIPLRGSGGPAALLWSLDSLVKCQFVGGDRIFDFDTITTNSSVLSSNGIIEHNGVYYWATSTGFVLFNGVMRAIPNDDNLQWFLENLNFDQRQKVFAVKNPRWSEIWWCFPYGTATECTHAVVYNYERGFWYDTILPNGGRTAGIYEHIYRFPVMAGSRVNDDTGGTSTWQHECGLDEISGAPRMSRAILSRFETNEKNLIVPATLDANAISRGLSYSLLEPDFDQVGDLTLTVKSRANARSRTRTTGPITIPDNPEPSEQLTKFKHTGRLTSFVIESNSLGGNYIAGSPLIHAVPSGDRKED